MATVRTTVVILFNICTFLFLQRVRAQEPILPQPINLDMLIAEAIQNNPDVKAARLRWSAAQQRNAQVSSLDDPMVMYTRWLSTPETRVGPQENVFMLSQPIPFPGKLTLKGKIADEDAAASGFNSAAVLRDVIFKLKEAYYDLYWVDQSLTILDEYLTLLTDFSRVAEEQYATGQGIQANVLKSQVEISNVLERKLMVERSRKNVTARINALLYRPADSPLGQARQIDTARIDLEEMALQLKALMGRQELQSAAAMVRKSEHGMRLAQLDYLPNFNVQASYITIPKGSSMFTDAGKDAYSISIGINLPIQLGKRSAAVEESESSLLANKLSFENVKTNVEAEVSDLHFQLQSTTQTLDLYEQGLILQAESSLESALSAYRTGQLDFLSLLDSERMLLQVRLGYVKEQSNYRKLIVALERAVGGELPR